MANPSPWDVVEEAQRVLSDPTTPSFQKAGARLILARVERETALPAAAQTAPGDPRALGAALAAMPALPPAPPDALTDELELAQRVLSTHGASPQSMRAAQSVLATVGKAAVPASAPPPPRSEPHGELWTPPPPPLPELPGDPRALGAALAAMPALPPAPPPAPGTPAVFDPNAPAPPTAPPMYFPGGWVPTERSGSWSRMGPLPAGAPTMAELKAGNERAAAAVAAERAAVAESGRLEEEAARQRWRAALDERATAIVQEQEQAAKQKAAEDRYAGLTAEARRLATEEPDFGRVWGKGGEGFMRRFIAVLASTISGGAMGLAGRPGENPALDAIDKIINRDIASQEKVLASKRGENAAERAYVQRLADKAEAMGVRWQDIARAAMREKMAATVDELRARATTGDRQARLNTMSEQLRAQSAMELRQLADRERGTVSGSSRQVFVPPQVVGGTSPMGLPTTLDELQKWAPQYLNQAKSPEDAKVRQAVVKNQRELMGISDFEQTKTQAINILRSFKKAVNDAGWLTRVGASWGVRAGRSAILNGLSAAAQLATNRAINTGRASDLDLKKVYQSLMPGWLFSATPEMIDYLVDVVGKAQPALPGEQTAGDALRAMEFQPAR